MKKFISLIISIIIIFSLSTTALAEREFVGETVVKDNMLFINGNSVCAAQLPNEFVYIPVEHLEYYGFDVLYNNDNGYKDYILRRNGIAEFVPEFTYTAEHYKNNTKVYTTDAKVYLDSDIPANVYELEDGTVLVQSDELAKYGSYNWDVNNHTISINFDSTGFLPVGQPFHNVLGLNDIEDIAYAVIVKNDGKCADIEFEDLKEWLDKYWDFAPYDRVIAPHDSSFYEYYIKLWTKDRNKTFIVYPNGGVMVGIYGEPCQSHGETKKNYIWYLPYIGNGRNALHIADTKLVNKYINERSENFIDTLRDATKNDAEILPTGNLLITDGASSWAKPEIQKAAACNLLPYELTDNKYTKNITRAEFCDLIYRLTATEFSPESDSRMGQWSAIDNVIYERRLTDKINSVSFSDCNDDKIKFLSGAGIIFGIGDGNFAPDEFLTREQAATILYRTAEFLGNKTIKKSSVKIYDDEDAISDWATDSVLSMKEMNIMNGVSERIFNPNGNFTVEQAIATMVRLYNCP